MEASRGTTTSVGRWISADWAQKPEAVPYSKLDDPQSLNLYEYVGNNPPSKADPDGHCCFEYQVIDLLGRLSDRIDAAVGRWLPTF
jgi:hypothetical protein